jgi:hypothetical protein
MRKRRRITRYRSRSQARLGRRQKKSRDKRKTLSL